MDFKALMTKLKTIDKRQVLNESVENTKPAPKIDKQVITESPEMKSSIARMLMQEFGIGEDNETGAQQNPGTIYSYNPVKDFKARRAVDKTQAAADANPEVYGYGGGAEAPQGTTVAAQDPAGETPELNIGQGAPAAPEPTGNQSAPNTPEPENQGDGSEHTPAPPSGITAMPAAPADPAQGGDAIGQAAAGGAPSPGGSGATSGANAVDVAQPTAQTQPGTGDASVAQAMANKPAAQAPAAPAGGQYVIKPGDNLTKIAKANGTTIKDIMAVNPQIKDPNKIMAGAKLNLPGKAAASAAAAPQKSDAAKLAAGEAPVEETLSLIKRLAGLR